MYRLVVEGLVDKPKFTKRYFKRNKLKYRKIKPPTQIHFDRMDKFETAKNLLKKAFQKCARLHFSLTWIDVNISIYIK